MEPVLVGDVSAPLLRSIALFDGDKYGDNIDYEPYEREYNPLITNEFQHIDIDIKDDYNKTLDFKFGKIYLSLHFRKIREWIISSAQFILTVSRPLFGQSITLVDHNLGLEYLVIMVTIINSMGMGG